MSLTLPKLELPDLPYDYGALEPVISGKIMELHHGKHHAGYVNNFNNAREAVIPYMEKGDVASVIAFQPALKFNGGGHVNHSLFWENLAPTNQGGGEPPSGDLANAIDAQWGSLNAFIDDFNATVGPLQGSGWGWLGYCPKTKRLQIATCNNQDPLSLIGLKPLLGVDVWEHAYYLDYENRRPDYLKKIWDVINWKVAAQRYESAK